MTEVEQLLILVLVGTILLVTGLVSDIRIGRLFPNFDGFVLLCGYATLCYCGLRAAGVV